MISRGDFFAVNAMIRVNDVRREPFDLINKE